MDWLEVKMDKNALNSATVTEENLHWKAACVWTSVIVTDSAAV